MKTESWLTRVVTDRWHDLGKVLGPVLTRRLGKTDTPAAPGSPQDVPEKLRALRDQFEHATVRLGIIGESGSGKSSLINAVVGRTVAPVGALVETTQEPQEVPVEGLTLVDLPGCGTPTWPKDTYVQRLKLLESYDGFILVTANRLKECDALLYSRLAREAKKPFFVVRSHFDLAVAAHGDAEARAVITPYIRRQLQAGETTPVYLVSSVGTQHYDLERLILDIRRALPEWKQVRFMLAAHAYGRDSLARKREAAERVVGVYAGLAAANALNPIPGLDVSLDVGILAALARHVISAYGLRPEQIEALKKQANTRMVVVRGLHEIAERFGPYLTEKFIITALRRAGTEVAVMSTAKWVPFVGTLLSAGLGYKLAYGFGEKLIDECEEAAKEVLTALGEDAAA